MAQKTLEKLTRNIFNLREEVKTLRSFIIGILGKDREGEYKSNFVRKVLRASRQKAPFIFKNKKSFLEKIR